LDALDGAVSHLSELGAALAWVLEVLSLAVIGSLLEFFQVFQVPVIVLFNDCFEDCVAVEFVLQQNEVLCGKSAVLVLVS
jgi:hypothetical protein